MPDKAQLQTSIFASQLAYRDDALGLMRSVLPQYTLAPGDIYSLGNGFRALVLRSGGGIIIAFRGTQPDFETTKRHMLNLLADYLVMADTGAAMTNMPHYEADMRAWQEDVLRNDLIADKEIFDGRTVEQFSAAVALVQQVMRGSPQAAIRVTGHSLGGGIANYVAGQIPGLTGICFAAPGYKNYGRASAAGMTNYANVNDTIAMVNFAAHCGGDPIRLDTLHSSFAVENALGLRREAIFGFNATPDVSTALTANAANANQIVLGSCGFLIARLIYHDLKNYAALLGCNALEDAPGTSIFTPQKRSFAQFVDAARGVVQDARLLQRRERNINNLLMQLPVIQMLRLELMLTRLGINALHSKH